MKINSTTQLATLIGHPVSHSFSPYIHNFLAEKYNLNLNYMCCDVESDSVSEALEGIKALGIIGSNVTIPHKIKVMESLDVVDKNAAIIGAVNTIKNEKGKLIGYNTDGVGFIKSVLDKGHQLEGKNIMVLGAGGASRAIVIELAAQKVSKIIIRNNTLAKAEDLANAVRTHFSEVTVEVAPLNVKEEELCGVDFIINTTPLGMSSNKELCPIDENITPPIGLVACDIVYTPHDTKFLQWASRNNLQVVHGIGMLINQALESFSIWTGIEVDAYEEVLEILKNRGIVK